MHAGIRVTVRPRLVADALAAGPLTADGTTDIKD